MNIKMINVKQELGMRTKPVATNLTVLVMSSFQRFYVFI